MQLVAMFAIQALILPVAAGMDTRCEETRGGAWALPGRGVLPGLRTFHPLAQAHFFSGGF